MADMREGVEIDEDDELDASVKTPAQVDIAVLEHPLSPIERDGIQLSILQELRAAREVAEQQTAHVIRMTRAVDLLAVALSSRLRGTLGDGFVVDSFDVTLTSNKTVLVAKNKLSRIVVVRLSVKQAGAGVAVLRPTASGPSIGIDLDLSVLGDVQGELQLLPNSEVWATPSAAAPAAVINVETCDPLGWISGVSSRPGG